MSIWHCIIIVVTLFAVDHVQGTHLGEVLVALADETIGMPLSAERGDEILLDGLLASTTLRGEQTEEVFATECSTLSFMESLLTEWSSTFSTDEMFRMKCAAHRCHTSILDCSIAICTSR